MGFFFFLPLILIGAVAAAGFGTAWLLSGMRVGYFCDEDRLKIAVGLAVAIPVLAATTTLVPQSTEFKDLYGEFLQRLWVWAAGAYVIGGVVGWVYCVNAE
jgi:hypothetical protein